MLRLCKPRTGTMRALAGRMAMGAIESAAKTGTRVDIDAVSVDAYTIPTDQPESDGTLEWRATTLIVVHVSAGRRARLRLHVWRSRRGGAHRRQACATLA